MRACEFGAQSSELTASRFEQASAALSAAALLRISRGAGHKSCIHLNSPPWSAPGTSHQQPRIRAARSRFTGGCCFSLYFGPGTTLAGAPSRDRADLRPARPFMIFDRANETVAQGGKLDYLWVRKAGRRCTLTPRLAYGEQLRVFTGLQTPHRVCCKIPTHSPQSQGLQLGCLPFTTYLYRTSASLEFASRSLDERGRGRGQRSRVYTGLFG